MSTTSQFTAPIKRILIDWTDSYSSDLNTGIQRVARKLVRNCPEVSDEFKVDVVPVVSRGERTYATDSRRATSRHRRWSDECIRILEERFAFSKTAAVGCRRVFKRVRKLFYPRTIARAVAKAYWVCSKKQLTFQRDDVLLLTEVTWTDETWQMVARARAAGARVGSVIYDVIPLSHREYFEPGFSEKFRNGLSRLMQEVDFCLTISDATRDALLHQMPSLTRGERHPALQTFRLGVTLDTHRAATDTKPRRDLARVFSTSQPVMLVVCTVEPRKNHALLLDAFDQLSDDSARLCIVGREGWLADEILDRIRQHPRYGQSVFMFNDLNDTELAYCYEHAKLFVFPSHVEGYGLPIVDALQYGLPVYCSDTQVHREVGDDFCVYFDSHDANALAAQLSRFLATGVPSKVRSASEFEPTTWQTSARDAIVGCIEHSSLARVQVPAERCA